MIETWKDIPGFERCYQASDLGCIRSLDRTYWREHPLTGRTLMSLKGANLKPATTKSGHQCVVLGRSGGTKLVHALVLRTFVGPYPSGMEILHLDHDPSNNKLTNLKYGSRSENVTADYARNARANMQAVAIRDASGEEVAFKSISEAARYLGMEPKHVTTNLHRGHPLLGKFSITRLTKDEYDNHHARH